MEDDVPASFRLKTLLLCICVSAKHLYPHAGLCKHSFIIRYNVRLAIYIVRLPLPNNQNHNHNNRISRMFHFPFYV